MTGIVIQWYYPLAPIFIYGMAAFCAIAFLCLKRLSLFYQLRLGWLRGLLLLILPGALGMILIRCQDALARPADVSHHYKKGDALLLCLEEPLTEKPSSFKAVATVSFLVRQDSLRPVTGKLILYFRKDSLLPDLSYGSRLIARTSFQPIQSAGNPGGFDYRLYCRRQGITMQAFLSPGSYTLLPGKKQDIAGSFLFPLRDSVLSILRHTIPGNREAGLAEALLIGYKEDIDKDLLRSYSNTGVVHIIAVSGMHLALIYWVLHVLFRPLQRYRYTRWLYPAGVLFFLWLFTLLTGGAPSIMRAAVMFTAMLVARLLTRRSTIYNTLALSAFFLLCYDPFWLWDIGFQLSFTAVLSIVIFYRWIYERYSARTRIIDHVWQLCAVTIAAQLLTTPLCLYHFHQFPVCFLLTNLVAVPLSSIILVGELVLLALSFFPFVAGLAGSLLSWLIYLMNGYIELIEHIPFAVWDGLQISLIQAMLLLLAIAGLSAWLLEKKTRGLLASLLMLVLFFLLRGHSFYKAGRQEMMIVYNLPRKTAIDIISFRNCAFIGDSLLTADSQLYQFHLKPARTKYRVRPARRLPLADQQNLVMLTRNKKIILLLRRTPVYEKRPAVPPVELLILAGSPAIDVPTFLEYFRIGAVVIDGSVPPRKADSWKKAFEQAGIPCHLVREEGAFVMPLP